MKKFIDLCKEDPDIGSYVFFDAHQAQAYKGDFINELHDGFVAIKTLAENVGRELDAEFLDAAVVGVSERYFFRNVGSDNTPMYAVFCSGAKVDLEHLVQNLLQRATTPDNAPESVPEGIVESVPENTIERVPEISGERVPETETRPGPRYHYRGGHQS